MNFTIFCRDGGDFSVRPSVRFEPCGPNDMERCGFVGEMTRGALFVKIERKRVPAEALNRWVDEWAAKQPERPGKRALKEAKELALAELLPRAFPRSATIRVHVFEHFLAVGTTSAADLDLIATLLVTAFPGLTLWAPDTSRLPAHMREWLDPFSDVVAPVSVGDRAILANPERRVSVQAHALMGDPALRAAHRDLMPVEVAVSWQERIEMRLTDGLQIKSAKLVGIVDAPQLATPDETDIELWRGTLAAMVPGLMELSRAA
jgi:recombination associated protein RdgC